MMRSLPLIAAVACGAALAPGLEVSNVHGSVAQASVIGRTHGAFGAGQYAVVWQEGSAAASANARIKFVRLRPDTLIPIGVPSAVTAGAVTAQESPRIAYANGTFLVVWQDFGSGRDYDVRAAVIDAKTGRRRGAVLSIASGPSSQARPSVAAASDVFLVVWQEPFKGQTAIRGVRVSPAGALVDREPRTYAAHGTSPAVHGSAGEFAIAWATVDAASMRTASVGTRRGVTGATLVSAKTGEPVKSVGVVNTVAAESIAIASDDSGNFMTVASREPFPNPWGWPGPGAVLFSRIAGGAAPEASIDYGERLGRIAGRAVPNIIDGATWGKTSKSWDAGVPGGFPGTADGLWPNGLPSVAYDGLGNYLFAWVKGRILGDRLSLADYTVWLRGLDGKTLAETSPARLVAGKPGVDATQPVLIAGPKRETLLLYSQRSPGQPTQLMAQRIDAAAATSDDGFVSLMPEKDVTEKWVIVGTAPETWSVKDGVIACVGKPDGYLRTKGKYRNYVLRGEWRFETKGWDKAPEKWPNAGFLIHASEDKGAKAWPRSFVEVQGHYGEAGSLFGGRIKGSRRGPIVKNRIPFGEWDRYEITAKDGTVKVVLNGDLVNEGWGADPPEGHICLQSEGWPVYYRNIRIKVLPD